MRLQSLEALQSLDIKDSAIFHEVPTDVWHLPSSLTSLRIPRNLLQTVPQAVASLPNLMLLDLSGNGFDCLPEGPYLDNL